MYMYNIYKNISTHVDVACSILNYVKYLTYIHFSACSLETIMDQSSPHFSLISEADDWLIILS